MPGLRPPTDSVQRARRLIDAHGRAATCWQILHPGLSRWFAAAGDGVVGFATYRRTRIVAGEPVCPPLRTEAVCREFEEDAALSSQRVCYLAAEDRLVECLGRDGRHRVLPIGAQPVWRPTVLAARFENDTSFLQFPGPGTLQGQIQAPGLGAGLCGGR